MCNTEISEALLARSLSLFMAVQLENWNGSICISSSSVERWGRRRAFTNVLHRDVNLSNAGCSESSALCFLF